MNRTQMAKPVPTCMYVCTLLYVGLYVHVAYLAFRSHNDTVNHGGRKSTGTHWRSHCIKPLNSKIRKETKKFISSLQVHVPVQCGTVPVQRHDCALL